jgi:hypothetical protein
MIEPLYIVLHKNKTLYRSDNENINGKYDFRDIEHVLRKNGLQNREK